jgi:hypothetical protein
VTTYTGVSQAELLQDPRDMRPGCRVSDHELNADLSIREPTDQKVEHLSLARNQLAYRGGDGGCGAPVATRLVDAVEQRLPDNFSAVSRCSGRGASRLWRLRQVQTRMA